jgi:hypothetical protein
MSLLYSLRVGNRVIIRSVSVVLGLGILVDTPYLAGSVCSNMGSDNLIVTFGALLPSEVWWDLSTLVKHPLWCLFSISIFP